MSTIDIQNSTIIIIQKADVVFSEQLSPSASTHRQQARRSCFFVIIGVLSLNFGLAFVSENSHTIKDPAYADKARKLRQQIQHDPDAPLVLMLGSSRTLLGFHAAHAQTLFSTPVHVFNFGTPASGVMTQWIYLKRLIEEGVQPKQVFLEVLPPMLHDSVENGPFEQQFFTADRMRHSELQFVQQFGFDQTVTEQAWRETIITPWSSLRFKLLGRLSPSWLPEELRYNWSRNTDDYGWTTPPRQNVSPSERHELFAKTTKEYASTLANLTINGRPTRAMYDLIKFAQCQGIIVHLVLMPESPLFRQMYPSAIYDSIPHRMRVLANTAGATVTDARCWLPEESFYDGHHPFADGAKQLTSRLIQETALKVVQP